MRHQQPASTREERCFSTLRCKKKLGTWGWPGKRKLEKTQKIAPRGPWFAPVASSRLRTVCKPHPLTNPANPGKCTTHLCHLGTSRHSRQIGRRIPTHAAGFKVCCIAKCPPRRIWTTLRGFERERERCAGRWCIAAFGRRKAIRGWSGYCLVSPVVAHHKQRSRIVLQGCSCQCPSRVFSAVDDSKPV